MGPQPAYGDLSLDEYAYVYILASRFKHLYIGLTTKIEQRIWEHKNGAFPGSFTDRYNIRELVHLEKFGSMQTAIAREKQLKRWSRIKKIRLIVASNPTSHDLSAEWGKSVEAFREPVDVWRDRQNTGVSPLRFAPVEMTEIEAISEAESEAP